MRSGSMYFIERASPRSKRRLRWAIAAFLVYLIVGFFILPPIVRSIAVKKLSQQLDREVSIRSVRMNPLALSANVRGLLVKDKDGEPLISCDESYANFQLWSFLGKPWVFREVRLVNPYARVQVNKDYSLNFSDLVKKFSQSSPQPQPTVPPKPLALRVGRLQISGARASFADLTPRTPFHRVIGPIEITLTKFHTDPGNKNPYAFTGTTDSGEKISWGGHFFLDPIRSAGELALEGLSISKYAPLYQDFVRLEIKDGVVSASSAYEFAITPTKTVATISNAAFSLKSLKVAETGQTENLVELDEFSVSGVNADAMARTGEVGTFFLTDGRVSLKRDHDATLNVVKLSRPPDAATNAPGGVLFLLRAATNAFAALISSTNLWSATLHRLDVTNCEVNWKDDVNSRPVNLIVDGIAVSARHLSNVPGSNQTATVSFRWNTNGTVRVETDAQISPPSADVTLAIHDLDLHPVDPYLEPFLNLFIIGSKVSLDGRIQMRMGSNGLPDVTFRGDANLDDFATVDGVMGDDLVKWKSIRVSGMNATLSPPTVAVKEIALIEPYARIAVETNHTLNLLAALRMGGTNALGAETNQTPSAPEPQPQSAVAQKGGMGQRLGSLLRETLAANTNSAGVSLLPTIAIDAVVISNATVQFNDRSLQPPVSMGIDEINGTIGSLSSTELKRADLHLTAKVDRTGPIEIAGKINPLNQSAPTELQVTFQNIDLSPASPYAARFLGYRLNRGKLNLNVNYEISDRKLKATNVLVLDQFKLGQRVSSPDATKLPVKLAIIILTDTEGKIKLDVPIEGSLDDPQFHFGRVIGRVIGNIITKLVTSPFSALGALFGGKGEEIAYQDFTPGSAELQTNNLAKLETLLDGLIKQPDLELGIEGSYDPVADRDALRWRKLDREFRQQKWVEMRSGAQARVSPDTITLSPEERQMYLVKTYEKLLAVKQAAESGVSAAQSPQKRPASPPEKAAEVMVQAFRPAPPPAPVDDMERTVLDSIVVGNDELHELAGQRAQRIRDKILESAKLPPERIYMVDVQAAASGNTASRVYFHLQ